MIGGRRLTVSVRGQPVEVEYVVVGGTRDELSVYLVRNGRSDWIIFGGAAVWPPLTSVEIAGIELACLNDLRERRAAGLALVGAA